MAAINLLVLADPATPQLAMLQTLAQTHVAVGDRPEAFARITAGADVILHMSIWRNTLER